MENISSLNESLLILKDLVHARLADYFKKKEENDIAIVTEITINDEALALFNSTFGLAISGDEYIILLIALAPHLQPNFYETIIHRYLPQGGDFAEIGGVKGTNYRGMLPTGETAQFIIGGSDLAKRLYVQGLLQHDSALLKGHLLWLDEVRDGEPVMSGKIMLSGEWLNRLLTGFDMPPKFSGEFPAKKIVTAMDWEDLVLNNYTQSLINDVKIWLQHNKTIMQDEVLHKKLKPGYRVLFHGPPGTGKTLTATLLGKQFNRDVYRVDLSQVVSKYIGETEKNLEKVFSKAVNKEWVLFFDEADALFGKRTNVQSAHDRYANQEVSYLLQRIEDFPGLLILASNFKSNMDDAFLRRFQTVVHFAAPNIAERLRLWEKTLPSSIQPESLFNLAEISEKYELTGAAILNIVQYATLQAVSKNDAFIRRADILEGIKREFRKEEKTVSH